MTKYLYMTILFNVLSYAAYTQSSKDSIPSLDLTKIAVVNQGHSYITFPTDIGNIAPLLFEASVNPSFIIRERKDSRLVGVLSSKIIIRMHNESSFPIKTPSYIPQISVYYLPEKKRSSKHITFFGKIAHHSNGQDGNFNNEDGSINQLSGNFATNFLELGLIKTSYNPQLNALFLKSSLEFHPKKWKLEELHGKYSGLRWHNSFSAFKLPEKNTFNKDRKARFSAKIETTWMLDKIDDWDAFNLNRFNASFTFYYHPKFLEDIGLFVQFYHGMDYYNIHFQQQLDVIRFGLMTEVLRF